MSVNNTAQPQAANLVSPPSQTANLQPSPDGAPPRDATSGDAAPRDAANVDVANVDLDWVWREVRKRVFIKLPFSLGLADAMEAVIPITLDKDTLVVGLPSRKFQLANHLNATPVRNTIENILRQAAKRPIHFELIEGATIEDWKDIKCRREKAHDAVIAMAEQNVNAHHFDDVLNQIVAEMRRRVTSTPDRIFPQVRVQLMLELVPSLADAEDMLFPDPNTHEARRTMARALDRVAGFLDISPFDLALEVERYRLEHRGEKRTETTPPENEMATK